MFLRRILFFQLLLLLSACKPAGQSPEKLTIGVISFGSGDRSVEQYSELKNYLSTELNSIIELEPTYNEIKALTQIKRQNWDLIFAPPGLAATAIAEREYIPMFSLEGVQRTRSVIVVDRESQINKLSQLARRPIALGQPGSATGYYLPIYNLYGLTVASVSFASTPKKVLELIAQREVAAGAMSLADFNRYRSDFPQTKFRILHTDSHNVPNGVVLIAPTVTENHQKQIRKALTNVSPAIAASAGYITTAPIPDYQYLISVVERVMPIAERIKQKPAPLYEQKTSPTLTPETEEN